MIGQCLPDKIANTGMRIEQKTPDREKMSHIFVNQWINKDVRDSLPVWALSGPGQLTRVCPGLEEAFPL